MHSRDRKWPLVFWLAAIELSILPIAFVILYALTGITPQQMLSRVDWASLDTYESVFFVLAVAGFLLTFARFGVQARRRERIRMRALVGDDSTMPTANVALDLFPGVAPDTLHRGSFSLQWANSSVITASREGLRWQRHKKRDVLIAWTDARLLEVIEVRRTDRPKKTEIFERGYCLYASPNRFVEWTDAPESQEPGECLSWEQKNRLQQELLAIVASRTNLPLRVIPNGPSTRKKMSFRSKISLVGLAFGLFLASFPLGTGILSLAAPLTTSFALNLSVAIIYCGVGLLLVGLMANGLMEIAHPRPPKPAPPSVSLPFAPLEATRETSVAIRFGGRLRDRLIALLLLVASLVSHIYLVIRAMRDFSIDDLKHDTLTDPHKLGLDLLMTSALIGISILCAVLFSRPIVLTADAEGIHQGKGRKQETVSWADVAILIASVAPLNSVASYTVVEVPPRSNHVIWPAGARWVRPPDGALPSDPGGQFAAIVAQRAGVQPVAKWE